MKTGYVKKLYALLQLMITFLAANGQYDAAENKMWAFGSRCGLDFNNGQPQPFETGMRSEGGCASVCDEAGRLLFYASPDTVWNRQHTPMPNGYDLTRTVYPYNAYRGTSIVPVIGKLNKYYVFTLSDVNGSSPTNAVLSYSLVDMTLNGGLGDVVAGQKQVLLDSGLAEAMVVVRGNNCNLWLLVHNMEDNMFKAYGITANGISTQPIISAVGTLTPQHSQTVGFYFSSIKVSPDRQKICICNVPAFNDGGAILYNFDPNTGIVSDPFTISDGVYFSSCFSPDSKKLYLANIFLDQVDLSLPDSNAIRQSKTRIADFDPATHNACDMRLGPDGKIYGVLTDFYRNIACINYPDSPAASCGFTFSTNTGHWSYTRTQLTMEYASIYTSRHQLRTERDICTEGDPVTLSAPAGHTEYYWDNGSTDSARTIQNTGKYWVQTIIDCNTLQVDTFVVSEQDLHFSLGPDTALCYGEYVTVHIPVDSATYLWQDGFRLRDRNIASAGSYIATVTKNGCSRSDTINILKQDCICNIAVPTAFTPNADGLNDAFGPIIKCTRGFTYYRFRIYNRWGQLVFETSNPAMKWQGYNQQAGTYFYEIVYSTEALNKGHLSIFKESDLKVYKGDVTLIK